MTREKLVEKLSKVGIKGEWINYDKNGFSRTFEFKLGNQTIQIEWYCNYSTIMIGNAHFCFDSILLHSGYPMQGEWIAFSFRNEHPEKKDSLEVQTQREFVHMLQIEAKEQAKRKEYCSVVL